MQLKFACRTIYFEIRRLKNIEFLARSPSKYLERDRFCNSSLGSGTWTRDLDQLGMTWTAVQCRGCLSCSDRSANDKCSLLSIQHCAFNARYNILDFACSKVRGWEERDVQKTLYSMLYYRNVCTII